MVGLSAAWKVVQRVARLAVLWAGKLDEMLRVKMWVRQLTVRELEQLLGQTKNCGRGTGCR